LAGTNWNTIGYNIIQGAFSDGDIAELAINYSEYNVNSQAIISYLGHKWGIVTTQDAVTPGYPSLYAENVAWWRADTLWIPPNLVDGDAVSQWPDSSGGGRHANGTGATRPILKTNVLGGRPVVRFSAAGSQKLTFAPSIPVPGDVTYFVVAKRTGATFASIGGNINSTYGPLNTDGVTLYSGSNLGFVPLSDTSVTTAFHVLTSDLQIGVFTAYYIDGTQFPSASSPYPNAGVLTTLGAHLDPITYMDGDIAEIIVYSGAVALRLKLTLLLVTLLVVMPAPGELEAMAGDRRKIKRYLRQHGAHATEEQLDAVVTPMAVGDRANIEKYLGTKYGITVAGGTAVDPATIPGMLGWWKADSLL
jgi:hypothetical protein